MGGLFGQEYIRALMVVGWLLWRQGIGVRRLTYEKNYSDSVAKCQCFWWRIQWA
jgi:hypothetical protein